MRSPQGSVRPAKIKQQPCSQTGRPAGVVGDFQVLRLTNDFSLFHLPRLSNLILSWFIVNGAFFLLIPLLGFVEATFFGKVFFSVLWLLGFLIGVLVVALMVIGLYRPYVTISFKGIVLTCMAVVLCCPFLCVVMIPIGLVYGVVEEAFNRNVSVGVSIPATLCGAIALGKLSSSRWGQNCAKMFTFARKMMARSANGVLAVDSRKPIVYLRPFVADDARNRDAFFPLESRWDFNPYSPASWLRLQPPFLEEIICEGLSYVAPVMAIGRPGEKLPNLGAARVYVEDDLWKQEVDRMLRISRFACLVIGSSTGLRWELERILDAGDERKLLVAIPQDEDFSASWRDFRHITSAYSIRLPERLPEQTLAILFCNGWAPVLITGRPTIANYRAIAWEMTTLSVCSTLK